MIRTAQALHPLEPTRSRGARVTLDVTFDRAHFVTFDAPPLLREGPP
jgi:hypothetical protein